MTKQKLWVYVSAPYTLPDPVTNTRTAIEAGTLILKAGHVPIIPHLSLLWHFLYPRPWEEWIAYDLDLIARCDLVLRLPGASTGADIEVEHAIRIGKDVLTSPANKIDWFALAKT